MYLKFAFELKNGLSINEHEYLLEKSMRSIQREYENKSYGKEFDKSKVKVSIYAGTLPDTYIVQLRLSEDEPCQTK